MEGKLQPCSVCLEIAPDLRRISKIGKDSLSPASKLKSCVSEIEWKSHYMICTPCSASLDIVYQFRAKCLKSEAIRSQVIPKSIPEETCDSSFAPNPGAVTHLLTAHNVKVPFMCNTRLNSCHNLIQCLQYHKGHLNHICAFCGKGFSRKSDLNVHEKIHLNKKQYKCELCPKSFNTHKDLRSHKYVVHTDPSVWQHTCEICSKRFPVKTTLDAHVRRHKNERPYACHLCTKRFVVKSVLQRHFLTHTNEKAFACDICNKEYKDKRVMALHKKKVHGLGDITVTERVRKYLCHLCPKAFYDQNKLTRHLSTHTGERPFVCRICGKKFSDKSYVKQHMKKVHDLNEDVSV